MKYTVEIGYKKFVFHYGNDAVFFAETAVRTGEKEENISITVEREAVDDDARED